MCRGNSIGNETCYLWQIPTMKNRSLISLKSIFVTWIRSTIKCVYPEKTGLHSGPKDFVMI